MQRITPSEAGADLAKAEARVKAAVAALTEEINATAIVAATELAEAVMDAAKAKATAEAAEYIAEAVSRHTHTIKRKKGVK